MEDNDIELLEGTSIFRFYMVFNNLNNLPVVTQFEAIYGSQIEQEYPELANKRIRIYTDQQGDGFIKQWDDRNDSPYTSNHVVNEIMRTEEIYNRCEFTVQEEYAILAHELGHMIARFRGEKVQNNLQEEKNADQMTVNLGLADHMKSAIQKMIDLNIHPENNAEMLQRISVM